MTRRLYILFMTVALVMCASVAWGKAKISLTDLVNGAKPNFATVNITYQSVDAQDRPVTLSAVLYYPTSRGTGENNITKCNYVFLNNHATITDNGSSPSGGESAMGQLYWMTTDNALVVCPDYLGFGVSKDRIHPYMCQMLTARNVVDCVKAAIDDAKSRQKLADSYYTINCGYSQGGGVTLAVQRYLETIADEATQRKVKLRGSICGAGCYQQTQIVDDYEQRASIDYPIFLPYAIQGMFQAYADGCLSGLQLSDCFTDKFNNSDILTLLNAKATDVDALNAKMKDYGMTKFSDIINPEYANRESALYKKLREALAQNDLITDDWTPRHPIAFYHYTNDEVVPYAGTRLAYDSWLNTGLVTLTNAESITNYGDWQIAKTAKYNNLKQNHRDYGTCFYLATFDEQLKVDDLCITVNLKAVGDKAYATLYSPYQVTVPEGVDAYTIMAQDDMMIMVKLADGVVPARTGVVLRSTEAQPCTMLYNKSGNYTAHSDLQGTLLDTPNPGNILTLGRKSSAQVGFYTYEGETLEAYKAYYPLPASSSSSAMRLVCEDELTGISNTISNATILEGKLLKNGNLVIIKNGRKYNVNGQLAK